MKWLTKEGGERVGIEFAVLDKSFDVERQPQVSQNPSAQPSREKLLNSMSGQGTPALTPVSLSREQFETALQRSPIGVVLRMDRPTDSIAPYRSCSMGTQGALH
jgi:hypothetical protein